MVDGKEYERWISTAKRTLESAVSDLNSGFYNWACFKAQQAAEFAVKALLYGLGRPKAGHSVSLLLSEVNAPQDLVDKAKYLDKLYVPTRYPDAWSDLTPDYYYTRAEAEQAIKYAKDVINYVEEVWRGLSRRGRS